MELARARSSRIGDTKYQIYCEGQVSPFIVLSLSLLSPFHPSTCWWFRWRSGAAAEERGVPCANLGEWALSSDPSLPPLPYFTGELVSILCPSLCCRPMLVTPPQCLQCPDQTSGCHWQRERESSRQTDVLTLMCLIRCKVETPIHDSIRELLTWECKEHGVKSWMC
jgi:hypothetical protein